MFGNTGKYLRVNLSDGTITESATDPDIALAMIGGRGLGIRHLYDEVPDGLEPLDPQNRLIFSTGVLAGTPVIAGSRWLVTTLSPLTGIYAKSSAGGDFGAWLKFSGFDYIVFEGQAESPVYLHITPDGCRLRDASAIWGKKTGPTQDVLQNAHAPSARIACIGPAGENLVRYAAIVTGTRTAARCGVGTVMGAKKLKAVVINARRKIHIHDPDRFKRLVHDQATLIRSDLSFKAHKQFGTTEGAISRNLLGVYPTRNFRLGQMTGYEKLSPDEFGKLRTDEFGCYACPANCGKVHQVPSGRPYAGATSEGPEYESYWSFSGPMECTSIEATIAADQLCDELGLDTISTGGCIGFAYELFERGLLTTADTGGLDLSYGNHAAMVDLIERIAMRNGFGNILAEGTVRAAQIIGKETEAYAMQVKGLELPGYEPRGLKATGFGYATSTIGGSHGNGSLAFQEWGMPVPRAVDRFTEEDKADIVIFNQNNSALRETGVMCSFSASWGDWYRRYFADLLQAATGKKAFGDWGYLRMAAERIINLERAFNIRHGTNRSHDCLPDRFVNEPLHTGSAPGEGEIIKHFNRFLDDYYQLREWDADGIPTAGKLASLGLEAETADLEGFRKEA